MFSFPSRFAAPAALGLALVMGISCQTGALARTKAKAKVKVAASTSYGLTKVAVPAAMLQGSLLTKGRVFYRSSQPESTLADIRVGRPANTILAKWGNPTRITVGTAQAEVANVPSPGGPAYIPSGGGNPYASALSDSVGKIASLYGVESPKLPGLGYEAPGMMPSPGTPNMPTMPGIPQGPDTRTLSEEEVTWTYDLQNGITLEFIVTNGIITQITVGGEGPWGLSKTRTGLQLGDSYKLALWVCGFPEEPQRYVGRFLRVSYVEKNRVLFTFLNKKIVGITIAMVPQEIQNK